MPENEIQTNMQSAPPEPMAAGSVSASEPEIHVIPEQFYGAALKTKLKQESMADVNMPAAPKRSILPSLIIIILLLAILGGGGYFVYLNRDNLFGAPPPAAEPIVVPVVTPEPPPPPPPPSAPQNFIATSTSPRSVALSWVDSSDNESAFRIERRPQDQTIYQRVADLPPNSTNFQDNSVSASSTYYYRIIARNESGESDYSNETQAQTQALPPPPPQQEPLPPAGLDTDSDGLSDLEEVIFESSPRNPDTDRDGFLDGNEVFNLYNPNGRAPAKLIESGRIKEVSAQVGYSLSIPKDWDYTVTVSDGSRAVISSGHGETFEVSIQNNPENLPILDWYMANNPDADKSLIMQYRSKGGYEGILGIDQLTTYIPWENRVFVFAYKMNNQPFINYRTAFSMMLNSLVLSGLVQQIIPAGTGQLPFEPAATAQGEVTQPVSVVNGTSTLEMPQVFPGAGADAESGTSTQATSTNP